MVKEADFQTKIKKWLKSKGCICYKLEANATTEAGRPDLFWCYKNKYGFLEVKRSSSAKFRPGQKEMIDRLSKWTYARVIYPENFDTIKSEIMEIINGEDS